MDILVILRLKVLKYPNHEISIKITNHRRIAVTIENQSKWFQNRYANKKKNV